MQDFDTPQEEIAELRRENAELKQKVSGLEARCGGLSRKFNTLVEAMLGDEDELAGYDTDEMRDIHQRIVDIEDHVEDHENQLSIVRGDGGTGDSPDGRAKRLRNVLYKNATKNNGKATLDRDEANTALGGGYHRGSVLDAMKRAADGMDADINGSSDLPTIGGITFHRGSKRDEQSRIEIDLSDVTGSEVRKNLTTDISE